MTPSDRSHTNHPTEPTVQRKRGSCRPLVGLVAQASPTPPGDSSGRCDCSARSPPPPLFLPCPFRLLGPLRRPNHVHLRLGPISRLGMLPTPHRSFPRHDAVCLGFTSGARCRGT